MEGVRHLTSGRRHPARGCESIATFGRRWANVLAYGIRTIPGFEAFLRTELRHFGPHYVCACLAMGEAGRPPREAALSLMRSIMHEKRGALLGRLCDGYAWPDAGLKALAKLSITECRRADYIRLGGYLRQPSTARELALAPYLSPGILRAIWQLPDWICLPNLLPILEEREPVAAIRSTFGAHLWDLSGELQHGVVESLRRVKSLPELRVRVLSWQDRLLSREPFPQPPIPGDERLKPLRSAAEMRHEAREMRSCLHKLITEGSIPKKWLSAPANWSLSSGPQWRLTSRTHCPAPSSSIRFGRAISRKEDSTWRAGARLTALPSRSTTPRAMPASLICRGWWTPFSPSA